MLEISSDEFTEWLAYYQIEPFGEGIADLRHGTACALVANINRNAEVRPEPYEPGDFIYWTKGDAPGAAEEAVLQLDDLVAQSQLIKAAVFGIAPKVAS